MPLLPETYRAPKRIVTFSDLDWVEGENGRVSAVLPLEDQLGVTPEGLLFRARALKDRPDEEVMLQIEFPHAQDRHDNAIERIDWRPLHRHNNRGKGPANLRHIWQEHTHRHSFDLNWLEDEERMRKTNLPIAEPVTDDPKNFSELLEFAEKCFRISNIRDLAPPPWEKKLL